MSVAGFEIGGLILTLFALWQIFCDILFPVRGGQLSDWLVRMVDRSLRHTPYRSAVGPITIVVVLLSWVSLVILGFAFIYVGLYPAKFAVGSLQSLDFGTRSLRSLYISIGVLSTFGTFDVNAGPDWLRLIVALEGLAGIALITASVSWLALLYPALERQRFVARHLSLLSEANTAIGHTGPVELGSSELSRLARELIQVRLDIWLFPISLYFYPLDNELTLAVALPIAERCVQEGSTSRDTSVVLATKQLDIALRDLGRVLAERFLQIDVETDSQEIFRRFADRQL